MKRVGESELWSYFEKGQSEALKIRRPNMARGAEGHPVASFLELAKKVAELQFMNPDLVLMFRGQQGDFRNTHDDTTLKPSLFRPTKAGKGPPVMQEIQRRYDVLSRAEVRLLQEYRRTGLPGIEKLERYHLLRWSIIQHYEICDTPLLDVTHSLRIASSFASDHDGDTGFVFVLGVPNLSGAITADADAGIQIIRLASVCPPAALRPHIQEGYLLGEYPDMVSHTQKELYHHYEIDFGRRLVAKFCFNPRRFWKSATFPAVPHDALYPSESKDPLFKLMLQVKAGE